MENNKKKFYDKTWFMWLTLIFFAPVGIFIMWRKQRYNKVVRMVLSGVFGLIFITAMFGSSEETNQQSSNDNPVAIETQSAEDKEAAQKEQEEKELKEKQTFNGEMDLKVDGDKVIVNIDTNVPDGGIFEVSIMSGNFDIQSEFLPVENGKITKEFTIPDEWGVGYIGGMALFRFNLDDVVQPDHVKELYGDKGQNMLGELAEEHTDGGKNGMLETVTIAYPSEEVIREKQNELFVKAMNELISNSNGVILKIEPYLSDNKWDTVAVRVSDSWYYSQEFEKERFAEQIGATVATVIRNTGQVSKDDLVQVYYFDSYGEKLASPKLLGGYKIHK